MPPRMMTGIRIAGMAFRKVLAMFLTEKVAPLGYFHLYACHSAMAIRMAPIRMPGMKPALNRRLTLSSAMTA